jgi:hypothetical protein
MQGRRVSYGAIRLNVLYQSVVDVLLFLSFTKQQIKAQSNNKLMTAELTITLANSNPKGVFGCEKKKRREKEARKSMRREKYVRNRVDLLCYLV